MAGFLLRRLAGLVPLLLVVSLVVFSLLYLVPGDPAQSLAGGEFASPERVVQLREELGFNDQLLVQYGRWLNGAARLDFGESLFTKRPVTTEISQALPATASLVLGSVLFAVILALIAGISSAVRPKSWIDKTVSAGLSVGMAIPSFWLGLMLVVFFAVELRWFPARGYVGLVDSPFEWAKHLVLPWISIGLVMAASLTRQIRGALGDVLQADYIRTARSKGISQFRIVGKHALKNASMPAITVLGLQVGYLFGGAVIVERIFAIPGIGSLMVQAVINQDVPLIQGGVMVMALLVVATNFLVDAVYCYVNPKVRLS